MGKIKHGSRFAGGIKRRWLLGNISVMALVLFTVAVLFSVLMGSYYYNGMRNTLTQTAQSTARYFGRYLSASYGEFFSNAKTYAEEYAASGRMEMQFINTGGRISVSSAGLIGGVSPGTPDIGEALAGGSPAVYMGKDRLTGERILAVSCPLGSSGKTVGVVRCVSSLRLADTRVITVTAAAFAAVIGVMLMIILSNLFFIRSIVNPLGEITAIAGKISQGSYGAQIERTYQNDEVGQLCDTINNMSNELSNAERMKNEFISSVSHELRTPLTAIAGWGETIQYAEDPEEIKKGVSVMLRETRRLSSLVEELLEFTAIEGGRLKLHMELMDPAAELEDVVYLYIETLSQQGIKLEYSSDDEIPEITGDPERLRQVFYNLIDNAAKHGGDGGKIDVSIRSSGTIITVTVRDYGKGIPAEDLPHVKKRFYRGSSQQRGSGIGLAVTNEIVERHGGELIIESVEGEGTTAIVRLPLTLADTVS